MKSHEEFFVNFLTVAAGILFMAALVIALCDWAAETNINIERRINALSSECDQYGDKSVTDTPSKCLTYFLDKRGARE